MSDSAQRRQSSHREIDLLKQPSPFPNLSAAAVSSRHILRSMKMIGCNYSGLLTGVPVAREVANFLACPLDLILIRRLLIGSEVEIATSALSNVAGGDSR